MKRKILAKRRVNIAAQQLEDHYRLESCPSLTPTSNQPPTVTANLVISEAEIDYTKIFGAEKPESPVSVMSASSLNSIGISSLAQRQPQNLSEWQLNLVLQRANLLQYYDIFISQGGDDVQQLLEAGEEEFLEIMALVGMASKPLHVRRLQKALQEYSTNPVAFQLIAFQKSGLSPPPGLALAAASMPPLLGVPFNTAAPPPSMVSPLVQLPGQSMPTVPQPSAPNHGSPGPGGGASSPDGAMWSQMMPDGLESQAQDMTSNTAPLLTSEQVVRLAECAQSLAATLPDFEPRLAPCKKRFGREHMNAVVAAADLAADHQARLDQCRRLGRIYGRFETKRKMDRPLTFHEASVNEAAAQICLRKPALLTRRDELFSLARQVVRDAGYQVPSKSMTSFSRCSPPESVNSDFDVSPAPSTSTASEVSPEGLTTEYERRRSSISIFGNMPQRKKRCLKEIGDELQQVGHDQDLCKMRVADATDLVELHTIQRDLQRLTQRQLELSDEQADALHSLKHESREHKNGLETTHTLLQQQQSQTKIEKQEARSSLDEQNFLEKM